MCSTCDRSLPSVATASDFDAQQRSTTNTVGSSAVTHNVQFLLLTDRLVAATKSVQRYYSLSLGSFAQGEVWTHWKQWRSMHGYACILMNYEWPFMHLNELHRSVSLLINSCLLIHTNFNVTFICLEQYWNRNWITIVSRHKSTSNNQITVARLIQTDRLIYCKNYATLV